MKVGIYLSSIDDYAESGGCSIFVTSVLQALSAHIGKTHHELVLITGLNSKSCNIYNFKPIVIPNKPFIKNKIIAYGLKHIGVNTPTIDEYLKEMSIDILVYIFPMNYLTTEIPFITTVWDLEHRNQPFFPEVSRDGLWNHRDDVYSKLLKRAAFVITGTEAGKKEINFYYQVNSNRIRVIPLPVPMLESERSNRNNLNILDKYNIPRGYIFYPAQFWPHKNHANLLMATKLLYEEHGLEIPLVFVGSDQGNLEYIRTFSEKLGLIGKVFFLGFVPREDLIQLYVNAFALAYVSFFGPDNLPPLEAFALGCPVVAAHVSGAAEQLGDAAILVDPASPHSIAKGLLEIQDCNVRQALIARGREKVSSSFTSTDYAQELINILDEFEAVRNCWR
jgi:glycosyltransferase involved in cell wall biosynthesis